MKKRIDLTKLYGFLITMIAMVSILALTFTGVNAEGETITYRGYVENKEWTDPVTNGSQCGTTGEALKLEGLEINTDPSSIEIEYSAHVQDFGWQDYVGNGQTAGNPDEQKRMEAVKIRLKGEAANSFDVYYRTHIEDYGWLGWASNDAEAGSTGLAKRMEAIEIVLLPKGSPAPGPVDTAVVTKDEPEVEPDISETPDEPQTPETDNQPAEQETPDSPNSAPETTAPGVSYSAHSSNIGWEAAVENGATAGHPDWGNQIEALQAQLSGLEGLIEYNTYVKGTGWMTPMTNGNIAGTTGQGLPIEAVNFYLYGPVRESHDIYYRTYVKDLGWLGWAKNGQDSGTIGGDLPVEGLEIVLTAKDAPAPGSTENVFQNLTPPEPETPVKTKVVAQPGLRTVQNFLATALLPVGTTNYVFGGGWNEEDTGAGTPAVTIGISPQWKAFFDQQGPGYDYEDHMFEIYNGLDCSGYVGWAVYNIMNDTNGGEGEVYLADRQARVYAQKGYGSFTPAGEVTEFLPGDVVSLEEDGHVYIVIGQCPDGSVVLVHASPPGVMITGTKNRDGSASQATELANTYMARYYPEYNAKYAGRYDRTPQVYLDGVSKMSWGANWTGDPDGIRNLDAAGVLRVLFNE